MDLLLSLYNIQSESNHEQEMIAACKQLFKERGCKVVNKKNNLYITKGKSDSYPCIAAHLDEVHGDRGIYQAIYSPVNDIIYGWSFTDNDFCGIGADDKNGIWVALQMVERLEYCKVCLFHGEEIGCIGSHDAWMSFFKNCRFVLQVDRRNAGDLITNISGRMVSDDFMQAITPIAEQFGYKETHGLMTDVETLVENGVGISCINMSCGYYNPHTQHEFTIWRELCNTAEFVYEICTQMTDTYLHEYQVPTFPYSDWSKYDTFAWKVPSKKTNLLPFVDGLNDDEFSGLISMLQNDMDTGEFWDMDSAQLLDRYKAYYPKLTAYTLDDALNMAERNYFDYCDDEYDEYNQKFF